MDLPIRRVRKTVEHVIQVPEHGLDAKEFHHQYRHVLELMKDEGKDLSYDDAFTVTVNESEIIFSYEKAS